MTGPTPNLRSRSSPIAFKVFDSVFDRWMDRQLHGIRCVREPRVPQSGTLLVCSNHTSWWDGFLVRWLVRRLRPGSPLFTVMLQSELDARPWLKLLGGLGVTPGSPSSVRQMLGRLRRLADEHEDAVVSFFPQGRIWPSHRRPLGFQRGVEAIQRALGPRAVLPVGIHLEAGRYLRPTAYLAPGEPLDPEAGLIAHQALEASVEAALNLVHEFLAKYGEDADEHSLEDSA